MASRSLSTSTPSQSKITSSISLSTVPMSRPSDAFDPAWPTSSRCLCHTEQHASRSQSALSRYFLPTCSTSARSGVIVVCGPAPDFVPAQDGDEAMTFTPLAMPGTEAAEVEFDLFFRWQSSRLMGQAYVLAGETAGAQDLVQESFLRAWEHWDELRGMDHPEAWVRRVMYNLAVSQWRRSRRLVPIGELEPRRVEQAPHAVGLADAP